MSAEFAPHRITSHLKAYEALVRDVETESCSHGPSGRRQTGEAYRACCGISYEYFNDIVSRDYLQAAIQDLPPEESARLAARLAPLDERLRALAAAGTPVDWDADFQARWPEAVYWWHYRLPRGVEP